MTFPLAFTSDCYSVVLGGSRSATGNVIATSISAKSFYMGGPSSADAQYTRWMATGV